MILRFRTLLVSLVLFGLFSCGGGGGLSRDDTTGGNTGGGTGVVTRSIQLAFIDVNGQPSTSLSEATPLTLTATATDSNGDPVADTLITYTFQPEGLAIFGNVSGTASTGSDGVTNPSLQILVGVNSGAGEITATLSSGETATTTFNSAGLQSDSPASIEILTSASTLPSSGSDKIEIYALVKGQSGLLIEGADVSISADSSTNLEYPSANRITGVDGKVKALLTNGSDKTNRPITITASVGQLSDETIIRVSGSRFQINGDTSIVLGESSGLSIFLVDSDGTGIPSESVIVVSSEGNAIVPDMPVTDEDGLAQVTIEVGQVSDDNVRLSALDGSVVGEFILKVKEDNFKFDLTELDDIPVDEQQKISLTWFSGGVPVVDSSVQLNISRGRITDDGGNVISFVNTDSEGKIIAYISSPFAGPASLVAKGDKGDDENVTATLDVSFVATTVTTMTLDASPDIINPDQQTTITAVLRDSRSNLVKGKVVNFVIKSDQTNGNFTSQPSVVSDENGKAFIVYKAGAVTSDIDGVVISASVEGNALVESKDVKISVGGEAFDITFGTGREITIVDETRYEKTFAVFVTDAQSNPAPNVGISVKMRAVPLSKGGLYEKGFWDKTTPFLSWFPVTTATCANEDQDEDGVLDENEDTNGDTFLTPGILGSVSFVGNNITDENGEALIAVRYPKSFAIWASVEITVLSQSEGTESSQSQIYRLPISASDTTNETSPPPSNPFGSGSSCNDIN
jgi:hypothetical protein